MRITVLAAALLLSACGGSEPAKEESKGITEVADAASIQPADPVEPAVAQPPLSAPVASRFSPCPAAEPGIFCSGPIIVRAGTAVISKDGRATSDGSQRVRVVLDFSVESRSASPVLFNLANQDAKLTLPATGTVLGSNVRFERARSGITPCLQPREACVQGGRDSFLKVPPAGETPSRFQLFYWGAADGSVAARLSTETEVRTEFEAYVLEPGQPDETVKVNFAGLPVQNTITQ